MQSNINFNALSTRLVAYLEGIRTSDAYPYPLQKGAKGSMYGSCFAALTAELLNVKLPDADSIKSLLYSHLDKNTGLVVNQELCDEKFPPTRSHNELYLELQTTYFARSALYALGETGLPVVTFAYDLAKNNQVYQWLNDLDWSNPWLVSNLDMFLGIFLLEHQASAPDDDNIKKGLDEYYRWHDEHQSEIDGFWGSNPDLLERMAGGYHIYVIYDAINRKIPLLDEAVTATKSLIWDDLLYVYGGGGGSCEDMDAIDILVRGYLNNPNKHTDLPDNLVVTAERLAYAINADGGYSWRLPTKLSWIIHLFKQGKIKPIVGALKTLAFKLKNRSHYNSTHLYSSCEAYPFKIDESDTWSCWFRASAIAMIAQALPERFENECTWLLHNRPGLGNNPVKK